MRHLLAILACLTIPATPLFADDIVFPDGTPASNAGGIMIIRKGNQTTFSVGGVFFSRHVKVKTLTPEGPVVTRFTVPNVFQAPGAVEFLGLVPASLQPASLQVEIPDINGVLYIEGKLVRSTGTSRQLESPPLPPGQDHPIKIRGVFAVGDRLLIEDKTLLLRAGQSIRVTFDGAQAVSVPLRRDNSAEVATKK
jgi:uncharacterized protein (TIGR03000 family)